MDAVFIHSQLDELESEIESAKAALVDDDDPDTAVEQLEHAEMTIANLLAYVATEM